MIPPIQSIFETSNNRVLFLDELLEFKKDVLESLREPLQEKKIRISRLGKSEVLLSDFILVASNNLCPCGKYDLSTEEIGRAHV